VGTVGWSWSLNLTLIQPARHPREAALLTAKRPLHPRAIWRSFAASCPGPFAGFELNLQVTM